MSLIAKSTIQEVNNRLDAVAVVEEYVRLEKRGGRWWGRCPFHGGGQEKTPSFKVDPDQKSYYCFGCQKGGSVLGFVMEMDKITYPEAVKNLAHKMGIEIMYEDGGTGEGDDWKQENTRKEEFFEFYRRTAVTFHHFLHEKPEGRAAFRYIVDRGISSEMIERFRLGYAPADRNFLYFFLQKKGYTTDFLDNSGLFAARAQGFPLFAARLIFPITDRQARIVAFGGRALPGAAQGGGKEPPKYINSPESPVYKKGQTLYAIDLALPQIRQTKTVYIAEGYMDVIALHQAGIENAVAPLGTAFTDDQAKLLRRWAEKAVLVFDADEAGQKAAFKGILTCRKNGLSCALAVPGQYQMEKTGPGPAFPSGAAAVSEPEPAYPSPRESKAPRDPQGLKDPADILKNFGPEILKKSMEYCITDFEYLISRGRSLYNVSVPEGKNRALALLFPYLEALDSDIERDDCIAAAAAEFAADPEAVRKDFFRRRSGERHAGEKVAPEEVPKNTGPVRLNDELFLLAVVSVNPQLYPEFRRSLEIREIEDPSAKELFIVLEECFANEESGMDALLSRIGSDALRNFIAGRGMSPEFRGDSKRDPKRLMEDGIKRIKEKRLRRRLVEITAEMRRTDRYGSGGRDGTAAYITAEGGLTINSSLATNSSLTTVSTLDDLLAEKKFIDEEIRRLEGRQA